MNHVFFLYIIIISGLLARSRVIVLAAFSLLLIEELELKPLAEFIRKGIELGLVFLLMAILAPMLLVPVERNELLKTLGNWKCIVAIIAGILATQFNGMGLKLLEGSPQLVLGIIVGSLTGIILFGGIPVGPLMAAGIAALMVEFIERLLLFLKK